MFEAFQVLQFATFFIKCGEGGTTSTI